MYEMVKEYLSAQLQETKIRITGTYKSQTQVAKISKTLLLIWKKGSMKFKKFPIYYLFEKKHLSAILIFKHIYFALAPFMLN